MIYMRAIAAALSAAALVNLAGCAARSAHHLPPSERTASLSLIGVYPGAGAAVSGNTVVEADLRYAIGDIESGSYFAFAQAETETPGVTTDGNFPVKMHVKLTRSAGQVRLSFPLRFVWSQPGVKHPLAIWFYLNTDVDKRYSRVLAKVGPVIYSE